MTTQQVFCGDNIELLKQYPDNHFDSIVTDAPYGLGKEPNAVELMKDWVEKGYHEISGSGFMGKEWDAFVPQPLFWKEAFRVLKHGGHVLSFFGTRTYDWGVMGMRFAGFEVRDTITWHYGSGFPKSHNISKALDKMVGAEREIIAINTNDKGSDSGSGTYNMNNGNSNMKKEFDITAPSTEAAKKWDGFGSALKPASEPIVLARKPIEKGLSIAENVLKWGTGGINIDGCRITTNDNLNGGAYSENKKSDGEWGTMHEFVGKEYQQPQGRFPANVIFSHSSECVCNGTKEVKAIKGGTGEKSLKSANQFFTHNENSKLGANAGGLGDANGNETVENWTCVDGCPIKELDEQSGVTKSIGGNQNNRLTNDSFINGSKKTISSIANGYKDKGTASRFFYTAKASKGERNKGLEEFEVKRMEGRDEGQDERSVAYKSRPTPTANIHPTIKPIKLMQYLVRLITPPNGIVLDPFNGSGTTGIAAKLEGLNYVGLELDAEYCKISEARIAAWEIEKKEVDNQLNLF